LCKAAAHHWRRLLQQLDRQLLTQAAVQEKLFTNTQVQAQLQLALLDRVKFLLLAAVDRVPILVQQQEAQTAVAVQVVMFIRPPHFYPLDHKQSQWAQVAQQVETAVLEAV
jgi:hypothetical protein